MVFNEIASSSSAGPQFFDGIKKRIEPVQRNPFNIPPSPFSGPGRMIKPKDVPVPITKSIPKAKLMISIMLDFLYHII